ncbi:MAG: metal-dependent hydrolase [Candidatus Schekmanbacteria bacterium]|nr:metal-dependent hydrolase [Candidatus Schekmanbacteria bacterium]
MTNTRLDCGATITWLGHSTFTIESPAGKILIVDPWIQGNPACPPALKNPARADVMLITHGHFDHIGDAVALGKALSPAVVGIYETCHWLESKGVQGCSAMNKGGAQTVQGIKVTMTHAIHSCGILDDGKIIYGGEAAGYVIELENGYRIYHAGDTALFSDMTIIGKLWKPDLALLPIGDHFTMDPVQAAEALRYLGVKTVIPMHFGTFPLLRGTPGALRDAAADIEGLRVIDLKPGESIR